MLLEEMGKLEVILSISFLWKNYAKAQVKVETIKGPN